MPDLEIIRPRQATRWDRWMQTLRSITLGPYNTKDRTLARIFGSTPSASGISVTEDSALTISAVWSAVTMISDDIASLPLMLYKRLPNGGKDRYEDHSLYRLLHEAPNPEMDSMVWRRTMQAHALLSQNAYSEIERDQAGRPVALWPLVPESVSVLRRNGRLIYRVHNPSGSEVFFDPEDMIHLVGYSHDGSVGCSMVRYARESMGLALATEQYGASFFGNGATMGGVVSVKGSKPSDLVEKGHREQLEARHRGIDRAHKLLLLYNDSTYTPTAVPPNAGQFNETRVLQIREIARWFKMPPHKLGDLADATYSNVEQMDSAYLSSCIRPWLVLWQQQLSRKLIARLERRQQFIEHETHGFLSVDAASRAELYSAESNIGSIQINEVRGYENRDPVDGGDESFIQQNVIPLSRVGAWWDLLIEEKAAQIKKLKEPPPPQVDTKPLQDQINELHDALTTARKLAQDAEELRDIAIAELTTVTDALKREQTAHTATTVTLAQANDALEQATRGRQEAEAREVAIVVERDALALSLRTEKEEHARTHRVADTLVSDLGLMTDTRDQAVHARDEAVAELVTVRADIALERAIASQLEQERDTANAAADAANTLAGSFTRTLELGKAEMLTARSQADTLKAERDVFAADAEALKTELARARADIATELERQQTQKAVMLAAMRSLFVDASERLLQREIDRARKHQATPEKLRSWLTSFYPMHADVCRSVLQPLVGPWTAITGGAPNVLLERLVTEHVEASRSALAIVADTDDPDEMAANLERTISRWEHERADAMADALVREGMAQ